MLLLYWIVACKIRASVRPSVTSVSYRHKTISSMIMKDLAPHRMVRVCANGILNAHDPTETLPAD